MVDVRYYYRFGLRSLQTISHIRSLRRYFDLSEVIFTYILPTTPITYIVPRSLAPRKTSYRFALTHTAFYCVPRHYTAYIDLDTLRSTLLYCILSIILHFTSRFISFALISF